MLPHATPDPHTSILDFVERESPTHDFKQPPEDLYQ